LVRIFLGPFFAIVGASAEQVIGVVSPASVIFLALGVLALPAIWYWRPTLWSMAVLLWFMLWLTLLFGLGEYRLGVILLVSLVLSSGVFMLGLRLTSGYLLPLPEGEHWREMLGFLRDFAQGYNFPGYVVVDELYDEDKVELRVPGDRFSEFANAPGFAISDANYAMAISSNIKFKGVKGPGVVFIRYADQVTQTVDLRPQLRAFPVEAVTKDGIQIKTLVFTPCRIDTRGKPPRLGEHLPYSSAAGFKAIRAQEMRHQGPGQTPDSKKRYKWEELSRSIATRILQDIISRYEFDELYGPYRPGGDPPRKDIAKELVQRLRGELKQIGIELIGGGISDLQPADPEVYVKRAQNWKEEWMYKIALQKTEGQAEWIKMVERARLEAQADLILSLGRRLESSMTKTEMRPEAALTQFVQMLDELMKQQPTLGEVVPEQTVDALLKIRRVVE
jgi:regulator of protease activity HflC (stomatin/prohibitin superfamily)